MNGLPGRSMRTAVLVVVLLAVGGWFVLAGPYRLVDRGKFFDPAVLSSEERAQLSELVLTVTEEPQETLAEARTRVWAIVRPHGAPPAAVRQGLEPIFLKIGRGPRLFWADAQRAVAERRPVKSSARTQWEAELMGDGWLTMAQQRRYDDFMRQIAHGEPIESSHGVEIALDDKMIRAINDSLDERELRSTVARLLTPPG
jgi:hypothetical protein